MADTRRLIELGMAPPLAAEVADQINTGGGEPADGSVTNAKVATNANIALGKLANVAAYPDGGITAGGLQATLNALADRIKVLEDA